MLKLMWSLLPNGPGSVGFWLKRFGSPRSLPALTAVIASRSDTLPSLGVISSAVVVTVIVASRRRTSSDSTTNLNACRARREGRRTDAPECDAILCLLRKKRSDVEAGRLTAGRRHGNQNTRQKQRLKMIAYAERLN